MAFVSSGLSLRGLRPVPARGILCPHFPCINFDRLFTQWLLTTFSAHHLVRESVFLRKLPFAEHGDYPQKPRAGGAERGVWTHKPRQYIRGQGEMATGAADQAARRLSAEDLPVRRSAATSNETFCPSLRLCSPARSTALICTKTSWPPSSG